MRNPLLMYPPQGQVPSSVVKASLPADVVYTDAANAWTTAQNLPTASQVNADNITTNTAVQTLSGKTLTQPVINGSGGALTLPAGPDTFVGRATSDTLTNKTLTNPKITNGSTGAGTPVLTANSPAVTPGTIFTWLQFIAPDGSTVFVPCYK